ncbi:FTR1 family iron permease [Methylocapsa palsarum]|uniref:High-affinity iron transporter n=1 Tax=Methylocapsa palsarum TaxID=1612308 RepID=A0A1I3WZU1_9HYPH|nr:FTR1 family protein [Methylocapsa palsarum]SFK12041.1 high-affinity iron transporter [Methylocapsa palsarum]
MIGALIIVFREVIEAGLIVGIVLAATQGLQGRTPWILAGVAAGVAGAALLAVFAGAISDAMSGTGQELFNAAVLAVAVVMLAWHNIWMARHGREMAAELKSVGQAVSTGARSASALAVVVGVAVLREGSEIVLFLYGLALSDSGSAWSLLSGGLAGLVLGAGLSYLTYRGLVKIPGRYLFGVTGALIAFLAAGMAAQCVYYLEQADVVRVLGATLWNTSNVLSEKSIAGRVLHTLVGYSDQPTVLQGLAYIATLSTIFGLGRLASRPRPALRTVPEPSHKHVMGE